MKPHRVSVDWAEAPLIPQTRSQSQLYKLNKLRLTAMRCRASTQVDVFEACKLLNVNETLAETHFEEALLRTLRQGLQRKPKFYSVGSSEESFDEKWLLQVLGAADTDDFASVEFLIRSRIDRRMWRSIRFLIFGSVGKFKK